MQSIHNFGLHIGNNFRSFSGKNDKHSLIVNPNIGEYNDTLEISEYGKLKLKLRNLEMSNKIQDTKQLQINNINYTSQTLGMVNILYDKMKKGIEDNLQWYSSYMDQLKNGTLEKGISYEKYANSMNMKENFPGYTPPVISGALNLKIGIVPEEEKSTSDLKEEAFEQFRNITKSIVEDYSKTISRFISDVKENAPDVINNIEQVSNSDNKGNIFAEFSSEASDLGNVNNLSEYKDQLKKILSKVDETQNNLLDVSYKTLQKIEGLDQNYWNDIKEKVDSGQVSYRKSIAETNVYIDKLLSNMSE